ncbi:ABC transporter permease [Crenalkalicoccus roseus]|uniref:ABC transporter permease n=1 Tax=Crenalkalicoccus roseus TaxID=1485588 RepID=UPI00130536CA|nr:ABC transporter permease [Crenalkalicoccus roseus]
MTAGGPAAPSLGEAFRIQRRVVGALLLRELGARFGRENLGYLWLFLEPALLGGAIGTIHHLSGHGLPGGLNIAAFWVVGYVPYYMVRSVVNRAPSAIVGNQSLLYHRRVTLLDILISRNLLEGAASFGAMTAFVLVFGVVLGEWPREPGRIVLGMALMFGFAHGVALLIAAGSVYTHLFDRVTHLATYLSLPISGAFFMVFWLPTELQQAALWVPTVHCFEMIREGQFAGQVPVTYDLGYVLGWVAALNLLGMAALRRARHDLVV